MGDTMTIRPALLLLLAIPVPAARSDELSYDQIVRDNGWESVTELKQVDLSELESAVELANLAFGVSTDRWILLVGPGEAEAVPEGKRVTPLLVVSPGRAVLTQKLIVEEKGRAIVLNWPAYKAAWVRELSYYAALKNTMLRNRRNIAAADPALAAEMQALAKRWKAQSPKLHEILFVGLLHEMGHIEYKHFGGQAGLLFHDPRLIDGKIRPVRIDEKWRKKETEADAYAAGIYATAANDNGATPKRIANAVNAVLALAAIDLDLIMLRKKGGQNIPPGSATHEIRSLRVSRMQLGSLNLMIKAYRGQEKALKILRLQQQQFRQIVQYIEESLDSRIKAAGQ